MTAVLVVSMSHLAQAKVLEYKAENAAEWVLQKGDWIIANVEENTLQYVREDHSDMSRPIQIGSGINNGKKMYYLGMAYNPQTPEGIWEVKSKQQQTWWNVFGSQESDEQLFLRLYQVKGDQRIYSHYGIHTTPEIERIFTEEDGYGSWGCILTRYEDLKMLEQLYELNDNSIKVVTTRQEPDEVVALLQAF